ncbi:MAG: anthranilate phosphoribosyltransferase [Pirellulales bacterium]|nr:anthranilate phosphoribosyltransferase [Pirellulales bacterium]
MSMLISRALDDRQRLAAFEELVSRPITAENLSEARRALFEQMTPVSLSGEAIDTCGAGGSGKKTINTSTLAALIVAAAGGKVAKHGNRSASGNCGAFDLLERLGAKIDLSADEERRLFDALGIVFLYAPRHHPAMQRVAPLRKAYGKKTIFNYLGPLSNPANVKRQLIGTGAPDAAELFAECLRRDGDHRVMIVSGEDGLDEVTVTAPTAIKIVEGSSVTEARFFPGQLGLPCFSPRQIEGGTAEENVAFSLDLAAGRGDEARKSLVLVNAAHALRLAGLAASLAEAYSLATETLASGKVIRLIQRYCCLTNNLPS